MVLVNEKIASYYFPVDILLSFVLGVPLHLRVNGKLSAQESNKICSGNNDLLGRDNRWNKKQRKTASKPMGLDAVFDYA